MSPQVVAAFRATTSIDYINAAVAVNGTDGYENEVG